MNWRTPVLRSMALAMVVSFGAAAFAADAPAEAPFALGDKETIVFVGDSITAGGNYVLYVEGYLITRFPDRSFRVINSGKSSETLSGLSEVDHPGVRPCLFKRFSDVVSVYSPTQVVSCYGINDGIYHPFSEERLAKYQEGVKQLIARIRQETKARLLVLTPPVYESRNPGQPDVRPEASYGYKKPFADYDQVLEKYAAWLLTMKEDGVTVADLHSRMAAHVKARKQDTPAFRMSGDGIHPNPTGHLIMAMAALKAWNAPALASEARIDAAAKKALAGDVKDLQAGEAVEFTWTSKVPMPSDEKWEAASLAVEKFTDTLNVHRLSVTGLAGAKYTLSADDQEMGAFTREQLAAGVDLTAIAKFPTTAKSGKILPLLAARRKMGYAPFVKDAAAKADPKRAALDQQIADLCKPVTMKIRLSPVK